MRKESNVPKYILLYILKTRYDANNGFIMCVRARFDSRLTFNCCFVMHERVAADVSVRGGNLRGALVASLQSPVDNVSKLKMHL